MLQYRNASALPFKDDCAKDIIKEFFYRDSMRSGDRKCVEYSQNF